MGNLILIFIWRYEKEWRFRIDRTEIDSIKNKSVKEINSESYVFLNLSSAIKFIYFGINFNFILYAREKCGAYCPFSYYDNFVICILLSIIKNLKLRT